MKVAAQVPDIQRVWDGVPALLSAESLAAQLQFRHQSKEDQLRGAYTWVTSNIRYSTDSALYFDQAVSYEEKIASILRRRKGVCEHYASLFAELANKMDIPAFVVHGLVKMGNTAHSWVAVQLNDKWYLCDPTWDAVHRPEYIYYKRDGVFFAQSHLPFDPIWQLLDDPAGYTQSGKKVPFNFNDSIATFLVQDTLQRYMSIERRMKRMNVNRLLYKTWQSYNRMKIVIIAGDEDMRLYNLAVENLNEAKGIFNEFVQYRNNQFLPNTSDERMMLMLQPVLEKIRDSRHGVTQIGRIAENHQYNTQSLEKQLDMLERRTKEQLDFLQKYLATTTAEREKLFLMK